jgi:tyrosine-protein phosphatase YwqE
MRLSWLPGLRSADRAKAGSGRAHLQFDFHSHLLPGVDDGMSSYEEARSAIVALRGIGVTGAVLTPHIYKSVFDNGADGLRRVFGEFVERLARDGEVFDLHLAAEYFADEHFLNLIEHDEILSIRLGDERFVLLEFPYLQETPYAGACLAALVGRGYRPVIAHVERYRFVERAPAAWLERFERANAVLQGDIGSLAGQYGETVRRFAVWLQERGKISIWGSDIHKPAQVEAYIMPGLAKLRWGGRLNKMLDPLAGRMAA